MEGEESRQKYTVIFLDPPLLCSVLFVFGGMKDLKISISILWKSLCGDLNDDFR